MEGRRQVVDRRRLGPVAPAFRGPDGLDQAVIGKWPLQGRRGHRNQSVRSQALGIAADLLFRPETNFDVGERGLELVRPDRAEQAYPQRRVQRAETRDPRRDDPAGHAHRGGHRKQSCRRSGIEDGGRRCQLIDRRADLRQELAAVVGQRQTTRLALEQLDPKAQLQRAHLLADRRLGQAQLLCCRGEAKLPGGRLEGAEPGQGRQSSSHKGKLPITVTNVIAAELLVCQSTAGRKS